RAGGTLKTVISKLATLSCSSDAGAWTGPRQIRARRRAGRDGPRGLCDELFIEAVDVIEVVEVVEVRPVISMVSASAAGDTASVEAAPRGGMAGGSGAATRPR